MISLLQKFDNSILLYIKNTMQGTIMDKAMVFFTALGNMGTIWIIISILLIAIKKYRNIGIMVLAALLLSEILGEGLIKHLVQRERPSANIPAVKLLITKPSSYSFPSGHTTCAFSAAGVLAKYLKKHELKVFCLASLIAFSRLYLYVHYPTDVLAGIILGLICSKIIIYGFGKMQFFKLVSNN